MSFTAAQVLAGSSVQGAGLDRVSGFVTARSGNTLSVEDATLIGADGSDTFIGGTTTVIMGPNTLITVLGQAGALTNTVQRVSVGSSIDAFGVLSAQTSQSATLDASAGHVRLDPTTASGLVLAQGSGFVNLNLAFLGGRTAAPFVTYDSSAIDVDIRNGSIGPRHQIQIGAQSISVLGLSSDPLIVPDSTSSIAVFSIGHAASSRMESFNTFAAFISTLQAELIGATLATGFTALGQYSASTFTLTATSVTIFLND